jgi:3-phenylpropionate/cinnamic acid dioxygenase small subunit
VNPVADELAIRRTLAAYCQLCDDGDFAGLAEQFAPDGTFAIGDTVATGRTAVMAWFETNHPPERRGKHLTMNTILDVTGDSATVESDFVHLRVIEGAITPEVAGRYLDTFVRLDGRWLILRRDARMEMLTSRRR